MNVLGACHGAPDSIFYPVGRPGRDGGGANQPDYTAAARICAACDLRGPCLQAALDTDARWGAHGYWAGATPEQRAQMRRRK